MRFALYLVPAAWALAGTFTITPADVPHLAEQRILGAAQMDGGTPALPDLVLYDPGTALVPGTMSVSWDHRPQDPSTSAETFSGRVPAFISYQIANVDDDPLPDIVFVHTDPQEVTLGLRLGYVSVLFNRGKRQFEWRIVSDKLPFVPNHVAVADFDQDGKPDILVGSANGRGFVIQGQGGGVYTAPNAVTSIPDKTTLAYAADLNGDKFPDVVYVGTSGVTITTGGQNRISTPFNQNNVFSRATSADVNRDGRPDVIILGRDGPYVLINQPPVFRAPVKLSSVLRPSELSVADMDGDGLDDLIVAEGAADRSGLNNSFVHVLTSLGNGTFAPAAIFASGPSFVIYDVDRDGLMDIVSTTDTRTQPWGQLMRGTKAASRTTAALVGTPPTAFQVSVQGDKPSFGAFGGTVRVTITVDGTERPPVDLELGTNGTARSSFEFGRSKIELRADYLGNRNFEASSASLSADFTPPPPPPVPVTVSGAFSATGGDVAADSRIVISGANLTAEAASSDELVPQLAGLRGSIRDSAGVDHVLLFDSVTPERAAAHLPAGIAAGTATLRMTNTAAPPAVFEGVLQIKNVAPSIAHAGEYATGTAVVIRADGTEEMIALTSPEGPVAIGLEPGGSVRITIAATGVRSAAAIEVTAGAETAFDAGASRQDRAGMDWISFSLGDALAAAGDTIVRISADSVPANEVKIQFRQ